MSVGSPGGVYSQSSRHAIHLLLSPPCYPDINISRLLAHATISNNYVTVAWSYDYQQSRASDKPRAFIHTDRSLLLLHLLLNTQLDRQDCCIERSHCEAVPRSNAWLPIVREPFFSKHRLEIIDAATEDGEHRRRTGEMSVAHHTQRPGRWGQRLLRTSEHIVE